MRLMGVLGQGREVGGATRLLPVEVVAVGVCGGIGPTTRSTAAPIAVARLAGRGGRLAELGGRQWVVQQGAPRLLVLIVVLGVDQRRGGGRLLVHRRHGRRVEGAQVARYGRGTASHSAAAAATTSAHAHAHSHASHAAHAAVVHQVEGLDAVRQRGGAARGRLGAVVHAGIELKKKGIFFKIFKLKLRLKKVFFKYFFVEKVSMKSISLIKETLSINCIFYTKKVDQTN